MAATATEQGRLGTTVAGRYRLLRVLGRGGMGIVYEADHTPSKRRVAIKIMHPENQLNQENVKRFLNEGANAGRVKHPNIVEFIEMGQDPNDGSLFIVLEHLRGTDLSTYLVKYGQMQPRDAIVVTAQVLQALAVAHAEEIVHRDIKPENIFLTKGPQGDAHVKIVDFGISKAINPEKAFMGSITQINTTVGTPHYMSPEQAKGEPIDPRADLWALGVVLYESLTGHLPFDGDNFNTQIVAVVTEPHLSASEYGVDRGLSDLIDRCLQKDRNKRFANAGEMLDALRDYVVTHPEVGLAENALFEERTREWPTAPVNGTPTALRSADVIPIPEGETSEASPVFPGMVRFEDDATSSDAAPTAVRPLDRSLVRPVAPANAATTSAGLQSPTAHPPTQPAPPMPAEEFYEDTAPSQHPALLVALALATALITGTTTYLVYQGTRPPARASNVVKVQFLGLTRGASVFIDGVRYEHPDAVHLPRRAGEVHVMVSAEGFRSIEFRLRPERDQAVSLPALVPVPAAPPPPPTPAVVPDASVAAPRIAAPPSPAPQAPTAQRPVAPVIAPPAVPAPVAARVVRPAPARPSAPAAPTANTFVTVGGANCVVIVDGVRVGPAPLMRHPVSAGSHQIECAREGGSLRRSTMVPAGQTIRVLF